MSLLSCFTFQDLLNIDPAKPSDCDFLKAEKFMCRMYNDLKSNSLDQISVRTLLSTKKSKEPLQPVTQHAFIYVDISTKHLACSTLIKRNIQNF